MSGIKITVDTHCEHCNGDGGWEEVVGHDSVHGAIYGWFKCDACDGTGFIEQDIDKLDPDEARERAFDRTLDDWADEP